MPAPVDFMAATAQSCLAEYGGVTWIRHRRKDSVRSPTHPRRFRMGYSSLPDQWRHRKVTQ